MKNIWVPLSGQIAQQNKIETIANNVANANTAGFKKDKLVFKEYLTALEKGSDEIDLPRKEWSPADFYRTQGAENSQVRVDGSFTEHTQGELVPTGAPLDLGLQGDGFFEVLAPNGVRFTRNGAFTISQDGELVTENGYKLLAETNQAAAGTDTNTVLNPAERVIKIPNAKLSIANEGQIFAGDVMIGKISVVEFKDIHALKKEGNSLYVNNKTENILTEPSKTLVHQGFIEQSNVNSVEEMAELIKAHRHFESIQKAINAYDNITGRAVNDIAKF
ncbi:MAG: flagellar basal-body rod protein FlgF [Bacteriovoracaceae bacterium]|nr:flagellar basal-body rod protein FlgF [Bacteriovoracaceae bacterium]